jgi:hypothetical protein
MKHALLVLVFAIGLLSTGLVAFAGGARAHDQEVSVDWEVAYANLNFLGAPVFTRFACPCTPPLTGGTAVTGVSGSGGYPTITLKTGDELVVSYSFRYIAATTVRGDLFWITRLGLDYGTIGRYINGVWIGASSFELVPNTRYNATLVIRSIQPTFRHLHVGVSVQNVGNIPAAPTVNPIPPGGPTLYGLFTDASGPITEPLAGVNVAPFGDLKLITPWPWAVGSLAAQIVIGFVFMGIMWWYGRYESRKGAKT